MLKTFWCAPALSPIGKCASLSSCSLVCLRVLLEHTTRHDKSTSKRSNCSSQQPRHTMDAFHLQSPQQMDAFWFSTASSVLKFASGAYPHVGFGTSGLSADQKTIGLLVLPQKMISVLRKSRMQACPKGKETWALCLFPATVAPARGSRSTCHVSNIWLR
ncbi:uncharacterized protein IWZ02DRAFT_213698 [Phyllosticta citriasiana]|uniref:uncharacterized protein n=1 Tax=Phyllosticta citriasiana TaxID=595635 RepID=UPI0030FD5691